MSVSRFVTVVMVVAALSTGAQAAPRSATCTSSWKAYSTRPIGASTAGCCPGGSSARRARCAIPLPPGAEAAKLARTHVYGYLLATVEPRGAHDRDPIGFEFHEVGVEAVPAAVTARFGEALVRQCYEQNVQY